jgi:hypothetical protein
MRSYLSDCLLKVTLQPNPMSDVSGSKLLLLCSDLISPQFYTDERPMDGVRQ